MYNISTKQTISKLQSNVLWVHSKLNQLEHAAFLGLILDQNLSWDKHVDHVISLMSLGRFGLQQLSGVYNIETSKYIYFSVITSHMA